MPAILSYVKTVTLTRRNVTRTTYFFGATLVDAQHIRMRSVLCKLTRQVLKTNGLEKMERCPNIFPGMLLRVFRHTNVLLKLCTYVSTYGQAT